MNRWVFSTTILLSSLCASAAVRASILPTDLDAKVGANYQPIDEDERAIWQSLGRLEVSIIRSSQRLISPGLEAYTRQVVERLIGRPAPELRIYLMRDATFNAAMYPSGMLIVNTGLLARVRDEAQFAAVLGHEAGHYFRKHSVDRYRAVRQKSAMIEVTSAAGRGSGNGWSPGSDSWNAITEVTAMAIYRFSRNQESEADAYGLALMARAGYAPRAASAICTQLLDEGRASAAARDKRYLDRASLALTHPATEKRITDLTDTANHLTRDGEPVAAEGIDGWNAVIHPYRAMLLHEQVYLNDPGAALYLVESQAKDGWTALLRFNQGEIFRLRQADGDDARAGAAYAAAVALPGAPAEAWRAHGYALLKSGDSAAARAALDRYLALSPLAPDAALVRVLADGQPVAAGLPGTPGSQLIVKPADNWKKLSAGVNETRWEEVWTRNGPQLDRLALIDGLPDGKAIMRQRKHADRQVPVFRAGMTSQDLMSMIETTYRLNGVATFEFESVAPVTFLGGTGIELRYDYGSGVGFTKKGRCVMRVIGARLFVMKLEGVTSDAFEAASAEYDQMVVQARLGP